MLKCNVELAENKNSNIFVKQHYFFKKKLLAVILIVTYCEPNITIHSVASVYLTLYYTV